MTGQTGQVFSRSFRLPVPVIRVRDPGLAVGLGMGLVLSFLVFRSVLSITITVMRKQLGTLEVHVSRETELAKERNKLLRYMSAHSMTLG